MKLDLNYGVLMASETRWLIIALLMFLTFTTPARLALIRKDDSRSSTISTTEDHVLTGYAIHKQRTTDIFTCAQLCLARPNCMSFNYENIQNGICELNGKVLDGNVVVGINVLSAKRGYSFSQLVNISAPVFPNSGKHKEDYFVFTTLGARGKTGPNDTSGYVGTPLESKVSLENGIQIWTVPVTGIYVIEASGGSGANGTDASEIPVSWRMGGLGAKIKGTFKLHQGTKLKILVGQGGNRTPNWGDQPGGGGGGSFVALLNNTPLVIAGGGGGGGAREQYKDGDPGQATENGTRCGGTGGTGGQVCDADTGNVDPNLAAGGGAGLTGDGGGGPGGIAQMASSFINGGTGGTCPLSHGGFGGGGFAFVLGGGGGGYSGGGVVGNSTTAVAGGGGSYNSGTNQRNMAGVNKGDGKIIIKLKI